MGELDGKVAIVTGAARGQGAADARRFVEEGARVVLTDVLDELGTALADELGTDAVYVHHDVSQEASWSAVVGSTTDRWGSLDVLVNNAAIAIAGPIWEQEVEDYRRVIAVNQVGPFLGVKHAAAVMMAQRSGSIVNVASTAARSVRKRTSPYASAKGAMLSMTRVAALELAKYGVRINALLPGLVRTEMAVEAAGGDDRLDAAAAAVPLGRLGSPAELADVVVFLASDRSAYVTGAEIVADGGLTLAG